LQAKKSWVFSVAQAPTLKLIKQPADSWHHQSPWYQVDKHLGQDATCRGFTSSRKIRTTKNASDVYFPDSFGFKTLYIFASKISAISFI